MYYYSPAFMQGFIFKSNVTETLFLSNMHFCLGCPFSSRSKEEITELMIQIPKDHPILTIPGIYTTYARDLKAD